MKMKTLFVTMIIMCAMLSGCAGLESQMESLSGDITGNTYECQFYTNNGELFMTAEGSNINMTPNVVPEYTYNYETGWSKTRVMSSVITITIDGHQMESCGSTVLFAENGLCPDVSFDTSDLVIDSEADGISDMTVIAETVNKYKNYFGKPVVVVIQSQLGDPICAYSGKDVYWEVCENLPKTTKLMIDGKALYIHRANFAIIDSELLN